jgi:mannitol operon repressor
LVPGAVRRASPEDTVDAIRLISGFMKPPEPEIETLGTFLHEFSKESDCGAALVAASMLDGRLEDILSAFFVDGKTAEGLLNGFNAPLGTFSSRASAAFALGLIPAR